LADVFAGVLVDPGPNGAGGSNMLRTLVAALVSLTALAAPTAALGAERYAAPGGSGTACSAAAPCALDGAVNGAADGDEVIIAPGDYGSPAAPMTTPLVIVNKDVEVHGVAGQPRPRLFFSTSAGDVTAIDLNTDAGSVRHLTIVESGPAFAVHVAGGTVEQVAAHSSAGSACSVGRFIDRRGVLRNSVCSTSAAGAAAVLAAMGGGRPVTLALRNVTAHASGAGSLGLRVSASLIPLNLTVNVFNSILRGDVQDVSAEADPASSNVTVNLVRSNYDSESETGLGVAGVTDPGTAGNQTAEPLLVNDAGGDFRQRPGSPTIDAGLTDPANGPFDLDGDARALGAATDIGADELVPEPAPPQSDPGGPGGNGGMAGTGGSGGTSGAAVSAADLVRPVARALRLKPSAFPAASRGASAARRRSGTTVSYRLSEPARVRFTVRRRAAGRRVGRRCVKPTPGNLGRARCTRYVRMRGGFTHAGQAGENSFRFSGRLRGNELRPGTYRLVGVPTDPAGNRGAPVARRFRILGS
jgi:hypothetical protein